MLITNSKKYKSLTRESRIFAQKAARSIVEIQQGVNNLADIVVLLEVLGYDKEFVAKHGFENLYDLAKYIYDFIDTYYDEEQDKGTVESHSMILPTPKQILAEGLALIFPWLGSLLLLFMTGVSLWMALTLPKGITTAFVGGVFLGLFITEGPLQAFQRLFTFYYNQSNVGEVKRAIRRSYLTVSIFVVSVSAGLFIASEIMNFPHTLAAIASLSMITISFHRTSYMVMYALKKIKHLIISYSGAFGTIVAVYFSLDGIIPSETLRYFLALGGAFVVLTIFSIPHNYKIITKTTIGTITREAPHFYNPAAVNDKTLGSKFSVQLWETLPHFLFGMSYFAMLFSDRIISWRYHPEIISGNGQIIEFNSAYHMGADLALLVILSASMLQYVIMAPIHIRLNNVILHLTVTESGKIDSYLKKQYQTLLILSVIASVGVCAVLVFFAPQIMIQLGGTEKSVQILQFAAISNVFLSIFATNGIFAMFLNKIKPLLFIAVTSTVLIVGLGLIIGKMGYEYVVFAYLTSTVFSSIVSTIYVRRIMKNAGTRFFARYV